MIVTKTGNCKMVSEEKLLEHLLWFATKIASDTYQTHDEEDPLLLAIMEAELKARNVNIDMKTIAFVDRLKRSLSQNIGTLWQRILGSEEGWSDLGVGDKSGCDLIHEDKKIVIELKNKYNTMNSSSRDSVIRKLQEQKEKGYDAYIGIINPKKGKSQTTVLDNGVKIVSGTHLSQLVLGSDQSHSEIVAKLKNMYESCRKVEDDAVDVNASFDKLSIQ